MSSRDAVSYLIGLIYFAWALYVVLAVEPRVSTALKRRMGVAQWQPSQEHWLAYSVRTFLPSWVGHRIGGLVTTVLILLPLPVFIALLVWWGASGRR